jgi:hypothetical protein
MTILNTEHSHPVNILKAPVFNKDRGFCLGYCYTFAAMRLIWQIIFFFLLIIIGDFYTKIVFAQEMSKTDSLKLELTWLS